MFEWGVVPAGCLAACLSARRNHKAVTKPPRSGPTTFVREFFLGCALFPLACLALISLLLLEARLAGGVTRRPAVPAQARTSPVPDPLASHERGGPPVLCARDGFRAPPPVRPPS
ncbi:hypothetical protein ACFU99_03545 [Streptomyces sp. NPDC057654]|uniref:hypothetical protein n=1 Tax=Streptomyces sp. NPDC057654 TaxID=3346196 RepID=UPI003685807F